MRGFKVSIVGLMGNIFLFIIKIIAGIYSNSIALISDAINSLSDSIASIAVLIGVKISEKNADVSHPFGHTRAQPVSGLIVAVFAGVMGFEVLISSIERFFLAKPVTNHSFAIIVLIIVILIKALMYIFFLKNSKNNPAIKAGAIDSRNDVLVSSLVLVAIFASMYDFVFVDPLVGVFVGFLIIKSGFDIGLENIDYLMGSAPSLELL